MASVSLCLTGDADVSWEVMFGCLHKIALVSRIAVNDPESSYAAESRGLRKSRIPPVLWRLLSLDHILPDFSVRY